MTKQRWGFLSVCLLFSIAVFSRLLFIRLDPSVAIFPDSIGYYQAAYATFHRTYSLADHWRTPVYPLVVWVGTQLMHVESAGDIPDTLMKIAPLLSFLQLSVGVVGVLLVYFLLGNLQMDNRLRFLITVLYALNPFLIHFERSVLTEAFSVFWMIGVLILTYHLLRKFRLHLCGMLLLWSVIGVMLRPSLLFVPILTSLFVLWEYRTKAAFIGCLFVLIGYVSVLTLYSLENERIWTYRGLTTTSDINLLGRILTLDLPVGKPKNPTAWDSAITEYRQENRLKDPWFLLGWRPELNNIYFLKQLSQTSHRIILANLPMYVIGSIKDIPRAYLYNTDGMKDREVTKKFSLWVNIYLGICIARFLVVAVSPLYLIYLFKKSTWKKQFSTYIFFIIVTYSLSTVFFAYDDFGRHLVVLEPFFYIAYAIVIRDFVLILFPNISGYFLKTKKK